MGNGRRARLRVRANSENYLIAICRVYKETDKDRLRSTVRADWDKFIARDNERSH